MRPKCIVFDEPTAMLDPKGRHQVMDIIHRLHEAGITVIPVSYTHLVQAAKAYDTI